MPTTRVAAALAVQHKVEAPLIGAMYKLLFEGLRPQDLIRGLMTRRSTYE